MKKLDKHLQKILKNQTVKVQKLVEHEKYMELDKVDSMYAFDRKCLIDCKTEKYKSARRGVYIKRTKSTG